jgi:uncharacterized LabA/DUF88 family protein
VEGERRLTRVAFLVDGFNLYHSIKETHACTGCNYRWLGIYSLCESFLSALGGSSELQSVHYFSAFAYHREHWNPGTVSRHRVYVKALESTGVVPHLAVFKPRTVGYRCSNCGHRGSFVRHEEKETDVAIAATMVELAVKAGTDAVAIVSGDTDLIPALRAFRSLSHAAAYVLFPYLRANAAFDGVASSTFRLKEQSYANHQLPDPVQSPFGPIHRPASWG